MKAVELAVSENPHYTHNHVLSVNAWSIYFNSNETMSPVASPVWR